MGADLKLMFYTLQDSFIRYRTPLYVIGLLLAIYILNYLGF